MIMIIACQYQIELLNNWKSYTNKIETLVAQSKKSGAEIVLLPEYAGTETVCRRFATDAALFEALQPLIPQYIEFFKSLAHKYQLYIQPGTIIEKIASEKHVNRAYFFGPNNIYGFQDKLHLTEYERNTQFLQTGNQQTVFDTAFGRMGIAICYDSEFPEVVRNLTFHGAELILVPSYTSTLSGYNRVFLSCRARAIENQCYVAVAFVVGQSDLSGDTENAFGCSAVLGPADNGFPDDGIIAQGRMGEEEGVIAKINFEKLACVRRQGQVLNFKDSKLAYPLPVPARVQM